MNGYQETNEDIGGPEDQAGVYIVHVQLGILTRHCHNEPREAGAHIFTVKTRGPEAVLLILEAVRQFHVIVQFVKTGIWYSRTPTQTKSCGFNFSMSAT